VNRNPAPANGDDADAWLARLARVDCPAFLHRQQTRPGADALPPPLVLAAGEGDYVIDVTGRRFVDLVAGFGAALLGHGHPAITEAVTKQSARLIQGLGDVFASDVKIELLERLAALPQTGGRMALEAPRALLTQSGSDAITAAIKTTTLATGRSGVLAFDGAYHGLGYGPLPACGYRESFLAPFSAQLNPAVRFAPYPGVRGATAKAALAIAEQHLQSGDLGTVVLEPLLGRGGCVLPPDGFIDGVCDLAHRHGALVIADEIWTGMGRAGAWIRSIEDGQSVDIVCLGKGLGGGLPISACVASEEVMMAWTRHGEVVHTSTHAGAPLGCAAALATIAEIERAGLVDRANELGDELRGRLVVALDDKVRDVRGRGLMIGVELADAAEATRVVAGLLDRGYLAITGGIDGATITLTPALTIDRARLLGVVDAIRDTLT
jgi:4-aminobutyrate aminotransferase / (S)-3-amino-2-methylpropionate transaminase / 5-aminovalerate transaminase